MNPLQIKVSTFVAPLLLLALGAGYWAGAHLDPSPQPGPHSSTPKLLFYQDPMHPAYRSDKPGTAPDCGMALEPVFDSQPSPTVPAGDPGQIRISDSAIRLSGMQTVKVSDGSMLSNLTTHGVVAADESRVFRVTALADGVVRSVSNFSPGSFVHRQTRLATYFVPTRDLYNAVQAYILASGSFDQNATAARNEGLINTAKAQARAEEELLRTFGLDSRQIRDLARTREVTRDVDLVSPSDGIVLERNISVGQALPKGSDLARIADLSRVWVLADVTEHDAASFLPGHNVQVSYDNRTMSARISDARQFDPQSRTYKVRLELTNPGAVLRPGMFVRVDVPHASIGTLQVPASAVIDTGTRKVVYLRAPDGAFFARVVRTGAEAGDQVEILDGIRPGDEVVAHGAFLLDSETRLRADSAPPSASLAAGETDPVCGMPLATIDESLSAELKGRRVHFCSLKCKASFAHTHASPQADQHEVASVQTAVLP